MKKGRRVRVKVIGGGGSGGYPSISSTNAAGGGGGVSESVIDLTGIDTVTITVGSGGNGQNTSARNGNPGGTSSFGTYLSATGGYGGGQISGGVVMLPTY
ncbi:glycine-rich domain-containing protein [Shigella flexneri]|uniref:glycine-rich domain-containing protein n=1 Tax=Shigella flexneri TaxID=623 RepID=UPI00315CF1E5